ncbi:hypothetical protein AB0M47_39105 [Hamadaea sp. NPDC051192]|uniref:hypothetical protein n=1 Tax=Hamadaea sp. NPDC051192 TaxID=3154940 RepID=UPI00342F19FB
MKRYDVSAELFDLAIRGLLNAEADWLLTANCGSYTPGTPVHPGHSFGVAAAALWRDHRADLMGFLAGYVDRLRLTSPALQAWKGPRVMLDDLLRGLPLALPDWFGDDATTALIAAVVSELPLRMSEDPNTP